MTIKNYSKQCLMISAGIMVLALLLSLFGMGINVGIDFSGGMSMQYTMGEAVTQSDIEGVLNGIGLKDYAVSVQGTGKDSINIRIKAIDEDGVQGVQASITEALQAKYPNAAIYGDAAAQRLPLRADCRAVHAHLHRHPLRLQLRRGGGAGSGT